MPKLLLSYGFLDAAMPIPGITDLTVKPHFNIQYRTRIFIDKLDLPASAER